MKPPVSPNLLPSEQSMLDVARAILLERCDVDFVDMSRTFRGQVVSIEDAAEAHHIAMANHLDIKIIWRPNGVECAVIFQEVE
jgi:hypothetical protein